MHFNNYLIYGHSYFTVQHECIPQAVLGMDILCQAKSGMGKTAVFVLATLQQIEPQDGQVSVLVMCHTRELAFQISKEYERFSKYMSGIKVILSPVNLILIGADIKQRYFGLWSRQKQYMVNHLLAIISN